MVCYCVSQFTLYSNCGVLESDVILSSHRGVLFSVKISISCAIKLAVWYIKLAVWYIKLAVWYIKLAVWYFTMQY